MPVAVGLFGVGLAAQVVLAVVGARRRTGVDTTPVRAVASGLRPLAAPAAATAGLLALLWAPPVIDVLTNEPSNLGRTLAWFRAADEGVHTFGEGWRIVSAQFGLRADWLIGRNDELTLFAGSPYIDSAPLPVLGLVALAAGVALWRVGGRPGRALVATLAAALVVSVVAVARTIGPMYDYRLRWTLVAPALVFVAVAWAGWLVAARRWPEPSRRFVLPALVAVLVAVTAVDAVAAARATRIEPGDADIMGTLVPDVLDELERDGIGPADEVLVADMPGAPTWFPAGLLVPLDQRGYDARVLPERRDQLGDRWVTDAIPTRAGVASDAIALDLVESGADVVATWSSVPLDDDGRTTLAGVYARTAVLSAALTAGDIDGDGYLAGIRDLEDEVPTGGGMDVRLVAVVRRR